MCSGWNRKVSSPAAVVSPLSEPVSELASEPARMPSGDGMGGLHRSSQSWRVMLTGVEVCTAQQHIENVVT